jgi:membrane protease YdiL (CAAX protease family)
MHRARQSELLLTQLRDIGSKHLRTVVALAVVAAGYFLQDSSLTIFYHSVRSWLGILPAATPHTLVCSAYNLLVSIRLIWWIAITALVAVIDAPGIAAVLHYDKRQATNFLKGLAIGLAVMAATVLTIVAVGDAQLLRSAGSATVHLAYGAAWLVGEILGSAGEELLFRGLILVLTARLFGIRTAMVVSALAFSLAHGANPGASYIWMVRLGAAGLLLAYSVFRSGSLWWAIGYHAGWNFASAPLFGAAGSGYIDQGHIFTFLPSGSNLITGGAVGPEGSVFAFVAVVIATVLFLFTTLPNEVNSLKAPSH